jgi:DNA-directed RNA polymerase subunit RPC12/RpoP
MIIRTVYGEEIIKTKVCAKCKKQLPLSNFAKANGNYPRSECRDCGKKQSKVREELKKLHEKPNEDYVCPVGHRSFDDIKYLGNRKGGWCLDHNHTTGVFRGWLCHDCNKAIGFFKDDVSLMKSAIKYLQDIND